jgi:hypothetical protein
MRARGRRRLYAGGTCHPGEFADVLADHSGMIERYRTIDQADDHSWTPGRERHQWSGPDQVQRLRSALHSRSVWRTEEASQ